MAAGGATGRLPIRDPVYYNRDQWLPHITTSDVTLPVQPLSLSDKILNVNKFSKKKTKKNTLLAS